MSEAIILYRGRGGVDPESLKPQTVTSNGTYTAPVTGNYWVAVVGGGGGGGGGCRNSWNSSQVFYGAGGTRGTLNSGLVALNQGDKITMNLGTGGSGGTNNITVTSNNSRGSNGGAGASSSFGSYRSGSGGTWGGYSWSWHRWVNTNMGWNNVNKGWNNTYKWNNVNQGWWNRITSWSNTERWSNIVHHYPSMPRSGQWCSACWYSGSLSLCTRSADGSCWHCPVHGDQGSFYALSNVSGSYGTEEWTNTYLGWVNTPIWTNTVNWSNTRVWNNRVIWSNTVEWNNRIVNTTTRCYTSIQQGSWWYTNATNNVSTSGTRTYRGDGGNSGRAGNAGFIVIVPPSL